MAPMPTCCRRETRAILVFNWPEEGTRDQRWHFPSRADCKSCHNDNAGRTLGLKNHQLNGDYFYLLSGRTDNQLRALNHIGLFSPALNENSISSLPKAANLDDPHASLEHRVRSYADANCAQCHRPGGVAANFDSRFSTTLADQALIRGETGRCLQSGKCQPGSAGGPGSVDFSSPGHFRRCRPNAAAGENAGRRALPANTRSVDRLDAVRIYSGSQYRPRLLPLLEMTRPRWTNGASVSIAVLNNDSDDGNALYAGAIQIDVPPSRGSVSLDAAAGSLVYTHDGSNTNSDSFRYSVSDPRGNVSGSALVSLTVNPPDPGSDAVAEYPFDTDFTDVSGFGHHLAAAGSPGLVNVQGRTAVRFRRVGDRLTAAIPDQLLMPGSGEPLVMEVTL